MYQIGMALVMQIDCEIAKNVFQTAITRSQGSLPQTPTAPFTSLASANTSHPHLQLLNFANDVLFSTDSLGAANHNKMHLIE